MDDSGGSARKIKVVDRRRFTEDGALRPDRPRPAEPKPDATTQNARSSEAVPESRPDRAPGPAGGPTATSPEFIELVAMLAQQAELMLVGADGFEPHPDEARRLIDALGVLEHKTEGNLSPEESKILKDVLFQLRSLFVQGRR